MGEQGLTAPRATVIAALCALAGGVAGAAVKGWFDTRTAERAEGLRAQSSLDIERLQVEGNLRLEEQRVAGNLELERAKFQTELILRAIDTGDQAAAVKTLTFFAKAGLIPAYEERVLALARVDDGAAIPTLRAAPDFQPIGTLAAGGALEPARVLALGRSVAAFAVDERVVCTAVLISEQLGLVPDFCLPDGSRADSLALRLDYDALEGQGDGEAVPIASLQALGEGLTLLRLPQDARLAGRGLALADRPPEGGEALFMIHHPLGGPKQVSPGCFADPEAPVAPAPSALDGLVGQEVLTLVCRTEGGSAGAPVLSVEDGTVFGIYVGGARVDDRGFAIPVGFVASALREGGGRAEAREGR